MLFNRLHCLESLALAFSVCLILSHCSTEVEDRALIKALDSFGTCLVESAYSFGNKSTCPPTSESELKASCKLQADAFRCIKERSKNVSSIMRRGLLSYVSGRQRHHRKYCTDLKSGPSQNFLVTCRCVMSKESKRLRQAESQLSQLVFEIAKHNYTDSGAELKQLCCGFLETKRKLIEGIAGECSAHREILEELIGTIIPDDLNLVCDQDSCPQLKPLQFKRIENYQLPKGKTVAGMTLYLFITVGEPNDKSILS